MNIILAVYEDGYIQHVRMDREMLRSIGLQLVAMAEDKTIPGKPAPPPDADSPLPSMDKVPTHVPD